MLANMRLCANVLSQHVIPDFMVVTNPWMNCRSLVGVSMNSVSFITNTVNAIPGLSAVKPDAGLYIFLRLTVTCMILRMMKNSVFVS